LRLAVGVGDVAVVPRRHWGWQWLVTWQRCHIVVVVVGVGVATCHAPSLFLSVSTPNSPREQWLAGWVVVLCQDGVGSSW
jgi:hypothetical protein